MGKIKNEDDYPAFATKALKINQQISPYAVTIIPDDVIPENSIIALCNTVLVGDISIDEMQYNVDRLKSAVMTFGLVINTYFD